MTTVPVLMMAVSGVAQSLLAMPLAAEATNATPTAATPTVHGNGGSKIGCTELAGCAFGC